MQSGLYGLSGMPGGNNTNNWIRDADYDHLDVGPAVVESLEASRKFASSPARNGRPISLQRMPPEDVRGLVSALSTPEMLQVL